MRRLIHPVMIVAYLFALIPVGLGIANASPLRAMLGGAVAFGSLGALVAFVVYCCWRLAQ